MKITSISVVLGIAYFMGSASAYSSGPDHFVSLSDARGEGIPLPLELALNHMTHSKKIVALGESAHGVQKYTLWQGRLIKWLVEKKGYRQIIGEDTVLGARVLGRWFKKCAEGDTGTTPPMDWVSTPSVELGETLKYLCEYNSKHPQDPVSYLGMDIWNFPYDRTYDFKRDMTQASEKLQASLLEIESICPVTKVPAGPDLWAFYEEMSIKKKFDDDVFANCLAQTEKAIELLSSEKHQYSQARLLEIKTNLISGKGWLHAMHWYYRDIEKEWDLRDLHQAEAVTAFIEADPRSKTILLAHNSHVTRSNGSANWWGYKNLKSTVSFLSPSLKSKTFVLGFTGYEISGRDGNFSKPEDKKSLDLLLHEKGFKEVFFPTSPFLLGKDQWWVHNENTSPDTTNGVLLKPSEHFDAMIFVDSSPKTTDLPQSL